MATPQRQWKAAASLNLLLDGEHPPARMEKSAQDPKARAALTPQIDARNTVDFRTTSYCGLQTVSTKRCARVMCDYYRAQLQRIPIWQAYAPDAGDGVRAKTQPADADVKSEPRDEDDDSGHSASAARLSGSSPYGPSLFRAVGILTHVSEPTMLGGAPPSPWELHVISDLNDDSAYLQAFDALQKDAALTDKAARPTQAGVKRERATDKDQDENDPDPLQDDEDRQRSDVDGSRLSLYTHFAEPFTGVVPGMAIGVIGEPFMRSTHGVLTGVQVRRLVMPTRPQFPWRVDRPLPSSALVGAPSSRSLRVHFCSGPYPRHEVKDLLRAVTTQALHRGADLLIVGGPLVPPFADYEKDVLPTVHATFTEQLESFLDLFEDTVNGYYDTRPLSTRMKVLLVSHRDDATQVPVLPTTMYAIADSDTVLVRSNPCRVSVNGVHIGINNEDVITPMRRAMQERWASADGSLRRVVEAIVQGRLYTPLLKLPTTSVDLHHLNSLYLDALPPPTSTDSASPAPSTSADGMSWATIFRDTKTELRPDADGTLKPEPRRVKQEAIDDDVEAAGDGQESHGAQTTRPHVGTPSAASIPASPFNVQEGMPHIIFSPSMLPPFAHVTHRAVPDATASFGNGVPRDESPLDDVAAATGVLVINQGTWSRRLGGRYELRVAELTIKDTTTVAYRGASLANGVACGVLHVFKDAAQ